MKFLSNVGQLLSEAERDTYSNLINSIEKYIQLSKLFNDKKDLRYSLFYGNKAHELSLRQDDDNLILMTLTYIGDI